MPKFLILWEIDPTFTPKTPEERLKLWLTMLNMVKADLQAGALKEWGQMSVDGQVTAPAT